MTGVLAMTDDADDVARVLAHIRATIGLHPVKWETWPGGWRGDIEAALVDAVSPLGPSTSRSEVRASTPKS
jgi:hypothetical protein